MKNGLGNICGDRKASTRDKRNDQFLHGNDILGFIVKCEPGEFSDCFPDRFGKVDYDSVCVSYYRLGIVQITLYNSSPDALSPYYPIRKGKFSLRFFEEFPWMRPVLGYTHYVATGEPTMKTLFTDMEELGRKEWTSVIKEYIDDIREAYRTGRK